MGKSVKDYVNQFKLKNENTVERCAYLPLQMEETISFIGDTAQSFSCYYNMGQKSNNLNNKATIYKLAVEKFILNKIYSVIYNLYDEKTKLENAKFLENKKKIKSKYSYDELMNYLEVSYYNILIYINYKIIKFYNKY